MLSDQGFKWKLLVLPGLAAVGFLLMLLTVVLTGNQSAERLRFIEVGYGPKLELSRDLEQTLQGSQRGMQDAVIAYFRLEGAADIAVPPSRTAALKPGRIVAPVEPAYQPNLFPSNN